MKMRDLAAPLSSSSDEELMDSKGKIMSLGSLSPVAVLGLEPGSSDLSPGDHSAELPNSAVFKLCLLPPVSFRIALQ